MSISQLQNNISCNIPPPLLNTSNLVSQSQKILSVFLTLNAFDVILSNQVITQLLSITQNGCFESQQSSFPNIFSASARDTNFTFLSDLYALDLRFLQEDISISNLSQPIQIMIPLFSNLLNIPTLNFSDSINNSTTSNSTTNSTFQCLFWNTTSNNWSSEGCKLVSLNPTQALCECNHLTIFVIGTLQDLIPPINQITPSNFNPQLAKQNYAIPILVGGVLIIFLSSILIVCIVEFIKARDSVDIPESHFEQKTVKKRRKNFLKRFWFALKHRHSFVGIFSCRENDPYNRRQRITLFIMKVLIMLALCAVFLENNQDSFEDTNLIACLGLSVFSSMASTPSLILILFFQFAKPKRSDKALPQMYKFPHCFIYIGYVIAILLIIVCSGVSILYSFTFSNSQVINWLITFCFAIPQNLLLNEPLRIFILAVMKHCYLVKIRHQPSTHLEDIFQSSIANSEDSEESSTPSSFYLSSLSSYHSASRSPSDFQSLSKTNSSSV